MSRLATAPPLALHTTALTPLTMAELDATRGGNPILIVAGVFMISAAAGMLDRLLFGGCKCR